MRPIRLVAFAHVAALAALVAAATAHSAETLRIDFATALRLADERNLDVAIYYERVARDFDAALRVLEDGLAQVESAKWRRSLQSRWDRLQQKRLL